MARYPAAGEEKRKIRVSRMTAWESEGFAVDFGILKQESARIYDVRGLRARMRGGRACKPCAGGMICRRCHLCAQASQNMRRDLNQK